MKWEYKFVIIDSKISDKKTKAMINEELNKLGNEGWELVNFDAVFVDARFCFVFKRPKEESVQGL